MNSEMLDTVMSNIFHFYKLDSCLISLFPPKGVCGSLAQILVPYLIAPLPLRITMTPR